jgi:glycosyltransferase involved in cell wall biosynthesis
VIITIDGTENNFSKKLLKKYEYLKTISWVGTLSREELDNYYSESNCLLFPSKLETWGLPISEFKKYNRPILFANLPYATETIGKFKYGKSFDPDSYKELATLMQALVSGVNISFDILNLNEMQEPYTKGWSELFDLLLNA